jgi:phage protein D
MWSASCAAPMRDAFASACTDMSEGIPSARPTFVVKGNEERGLSAGLVSLLVEETRSGICRCEATFGNWGARGRDLGFLYFDRAKLDFGADFRIDYEDRTIFDGRITALEAGFPHGSPPEITVLAEDRLQDLRMTRRTRTFEEVTDADVISTIARDHGLTPDVDLNGPRHKVLAQLNESDLAFVLARARATGARVSVRGRTLRAKTRGEGSSGIELSRGQMRALSVIADLAHQRSSVTVGGWDVGAKRAISERATDNVVQSELRGGTSGARILAQKLAERHEVVAHGAAASADEARARAESHMGTIARGFATARGITDADGRLRVGVEIALKDIGPLFSGTYTLTESRHLFDGDHGFRVEFVAEAAAIAQQQNN